MHTTPISAGKYLLNFSLVVLITLATIPVHASDAHLSAPVQPFAYVSNSGAGSVSVINTSTNTVTATILFNRAPSA